MSMKPYCSCHLNKGASPLTPIVPCIISGPVLHLELKHCLCNGNILTRAQTYICHFSVKRCRSSTETVYIVLSQCNVDMHNLQYEDMYFLADYIEVW